MSLSASLLFTAITMSQHARMPGMVMPDVPAKPATPPIKKHAAPLPNPHKALRADASDVSSESEHDAHVEHAIPMAGPVTSARDTALRGTDLAAGTGPAPAAPEDHAADRVYDRAAMAEARAMLRAEHGGMSFHRILFNLAEVQVGDHRTGYRWDGEGWFGGDIHRFVVKSEGGGDFGGATDEAEVQALYSRAVGPYFDLQAGLRQDVATGPKRTYATVGVEGVAPYWFDVEARLFLSDKGKLFGRLEGWHDLRVTQRLVLQPRVELNFAARDVPEQRTGGGLADAELGLRARYEIAREFAPYIGVNWKRAVASARFTRAAAEDVSRTSLVIGGRIWF